MYETNVRTIRLSALNYVSPIVSVTCCFTLSILFVASLYIWRTEHNRDHPETVKRRFCSVLVMMLLAPLFVYMFSSSELLTSIAFNELLGLRLNGFIQACIIPFLLTMLLFLGPIVEEYQNSPPKCQCGNCNDMHSWKMKFNILWVRNHIIAPLSEEFVYRACMMPIILQNFSPIAAVFITPLFFGPAHFHHIIERRNMGIELRTAILISGLQMLYTTVFGVYSAYLFARTGHFVAPFLVHAFCNHMGIPNIQALWQTDKLRRIILITLYIVGFLSWIILLPIATDPKLYDNNLFWNL